MMIPGILYLIHLTRSLQRQIVSRVAVLAAWMLSISLPCASFSQVAFVDMSEPSGILPSVVDVGMGAGVAAFDFDDDGHIDLFLPQRLGSPDRLYHNDGSGHFADVAPQSGIDILKAGRSALWFDYDDDHLVDLLIASDCFNSADPDCTSQSTIRLYRQYPKGVFTDVTAEVGLDNAKTAQFFGHRSCLSVGDIDGDGDLDLLIGQWEGELELYINEDGVFTEQAAVRGIVNPNAPFPSNPWQAVLCDFNGDGWLDIYVAVDFFPNHLWLNQGDGTFIDVAPQSGAANQMNDMGIALGDFDNDGDFDIYVANVFEDGKHNILLRNDSTVDQIQFTEMAQLAGVDDVGFSWGVTFLDANNDTLLDLAVTNGWFNGIGLQDQSRMFLQKPGDGNLFEDITDGSGFEDDYFGSCLVAADMNRDGDLDLLQVCVPSLFDGPFRYLENQFQETAPMESGNWLVIQPRQAHKNHWCIGAVVTVQIGDLIMTRLIQAGTSIHGQEPAEAFFGLDEANMVDKVTIRWPLGDESVWENVPANQVLRLQDADLNLDGRIDLLDIFPFISRLGQSKELIQADLNHDRVVDLLDAQLLIETILQSSF